MGLTIETPFSKLLSTNKNLLLKKYKQFIFALQNLSSVPLHIKSHGLLLTNPDLKYEALPFPLPIRSFKPEKENFSKSINYTPIPIYLELEDSSKWPKNSEAISVLKQAFYTRIRTSLASEKGIFSQVNVNSLDVIFYFCFRIFIVIKKEKQQLISPEMLNVKITQLVNCKVKPEFENLNFIFFTIKRVLNFYSILDFLPVDLVNILVASFICPGNKLDDSSFTLEETLQIFLKTFVETDWKSKMLIVNKNSFETVDRNYTDAFFEGIIVKIGYLRELVKYNIDEFKIGIVKNLFSSLLKYFPNKKNKKLKFKKLFSESLFKNKNINFSKIKLKINSDLVFNRFSYFADNFTIEKLKKINSKSKKVKIGDLKENTNSSEIKNIFKKILNGRKKKFRGIEIDTLNKVGQLLVGFDCLDILKEELKENFGCSIVAFKGAGEGNVICFALKDKNIEKELKTFLDIKVEQNKNIISVI